MIFFDKLNDDILTYTDRGKIFITGDMNSRVGLRPDFNENLNLDRYILLPDTDIVPIVDRKSKDDTVNAFGNKLLSLCKDNDILIVNGRFDDVDYTCYTVNRQNVGASVVDYLLTKYQNFEMISDFI